MRIIYEVRNRYEVQYRDDDCPGEPQGWVTHSRYDVAPRAVAQAWSLAGQYQEARVIDHGEPEED